MKPATIAAVLLLAAVAPLANAITLAPGQTALPTLLSRDPNNVLLNTDPSGGGPLLHSPTPDYPDIGPAFAIQSRAEQNAAPTMDFNFRVYFYSPLLPRLNTITLTGYKGFTVDAGYTLFANASVIPNSVSRSADGDVITYDFNGLNIAGRVTELLLRTNAPTFAVTNASIQFADDTLPGGAFTANTLAYAPAAATVPELSSLSLLTLATAALTLRYRRRRTAD